MKSISDYSDVITGIVVVFLAIFIWYLSSVAISEEVMPKSFEYAASFGTAISATFLGAFFAFRLNERREARKVFAAKIQATRSALFTMMQQFNTLTVIYRPLEPVKHTLDRHLGLPRKAAAGHQRKVIDLSSLEFLLESDPNRLMALSVAQDKFETAIEVINFFFQFHLQELQPYLEKISLSWSVPPRNLKEFQEAIGGRFWQVAVSHADNVYDLVPDAIDALKYEMDALNKIAREQFPGQKFITYSLSE